MKDPAPTEALGQGLTSSPSWAAGTDKTECILSAGKVILITFLYHTTSFPFCQAFFRLEKSVRAGKTGAKNRFPANSIPQKAGPLPLQFFPFLRSKFYLRIFRVAQAESWHFWLFFRSFLRPFLLLFEKVNYFYLKNRKFHLWKPSKRFLRFCAFCPNCERFFLHSESTKKRTLGRQSERASARRADALSAPWIRTLSVPKREKIYLRKPLMISSSASFSLRPKVISLISCSPAILPMAAS